MGAEAAELYSANSSSDALTDLLAAPQYGMRRAPRRDKPKSPQQLLTNQLCSVVDSYRYFPSSCCPMDARDRARASRRP